MYKHGIQILRENRFKNRLRKLPHFTRLADIITVALPDLFLKPKIILANLV